nr:hypothetical protein [Mesorhizobium sp.]
MDAKIAGLRLQHEQHSDEPKRDSDPTLHPDRFPDPESRKKGDEQRDRVIDGRGNREVEAR